MSRPKLPRTIIALGLVSLFTDLSGEMIYPLLPAFLLTLGAGGAFIGLIDGVAETTSALLKLASGLWADAVSRKKPLVVIGYGLASVVRSLVAFATAPWHVLLVRFTDRVGKGVRSSPRDALIADSIEPSRRGEAFGFHQGMDHVGAMLGPLCAYGFVALLALKVRTVFLIAAVPAALAMVALVWGVREAADPLVKAAFPRGKVPFKLAGLLTLLGIFKRLPRKLNVYLALLAIFTLGNSSDFFLLLRATDAGIPATSAPLLWALLHLVKASLSRPLGALSDRLGRRRVILAGWTVYALTYLGFALVTSAVGTWALFAVYGVYFAFTEGAEKALIADLAPADERGGAYGAYNAVIGLCALPGSLGFGLLWDRVGHGAAFVVGACLAGTAAVGFLLFSSVGAREAT